jgi:hypothetical protein
MRRWQMKKFLVVAFLVVPLVANAEYSKRKWTRTDTAFQAASIVALAADWNQTRQIAKSPQIYYEDGVAEAVLGRHPSVSEANWYFAGSMILNTAIAYALPNPYRRLFQVGTIVYEAYWINHNYRIGIRVNF